MKETYPDSKSTSRLDDLLMDKVAASLLSIKRLLDIYRPLLDIYRRLLDIESVDVLDFYQMSTAY